MKSILKNIIPKVSKGDLADYLFSLAIELDFLVCCVPLENQDDIVFLSDSILKLSKNL